MKGICECAPKYSGVFCEHEIISFGKKYLMQTILTLSVFQKIVGFMAFAIRERVFARTSTQW